jgi:osmotically-inducible protein OsmY
MKTDSQLKQDVTSELEWDPAINATQVGVAVKDGIVTLTGHLNTYAEKYSIERAVGRVQGVRAIAIELDVRLESDVKRSDTEIAAAVDSALKWHAQIPENRITVKVERGWVTLKGEVDWNFQRRNAEKTVRPLMGVIGVSNEITLKSTITPADVGARISGALSRHAEREARQVEVVVKGAQVTLRGSVDSWAERAAAAGAAWSAPGISSVINEIKVHG